MSNAPKKKDAELQRFARTFLEIFQKEVSDTDSQIKRILSSGSFIIFEGGAVSLTRELQESLSRFVVRAAELLGAKDGNEKALRELAHREAQQVFVQKLNLDQGVQRLLEAVFSGAENEFEFLLPNFLFHLLDPVQSITIGRIRAMRTEVFATEMAQLHPDPPIQIIPDQGFSLEFTQPLSVRMHAVAWVAKVKASIDNADEEAKWLIDVAVSLLRLNWPHPSYAFPRLGKIEPHPIRKPQIDNVGIKFQGERIRTGGFEMPDIYEIGQGIEVIAASTNFRQQAAIIFDPPSKSLAERVHQGLGWLTRGRQSQDRGERLLFFFTAIEALLSSDDKTSPIVQTIARHAAVILTDSVCDRADIATDLKKLYTLRSAVVHTGSRSVLMIKANNAQVLAEQLYKQVLDNADLALSHAKFNEDLSQASYGLPWLSRAPLRP
jgi:hypothetical protein